MTYERQHQNECSIVQEQRSLSPLPAIGAATILLSTHLDRGGDAFDGNARSDEGLILVRDVTSSGLTISPIRNPGA